MANATTGGSENGIIAFIVVLGFSLALGPLLWNSFREYRLLKTGVAANARVDEVIDTGDRMNSNPVVRVRMTVSAPGGDTFAAQVSEVASAVRLQTLKPGAVLVVRYDAKDRTRLVIDEDARAADAP